MNAKKETTSEQFARMIAERKGISVEEHLRRKRAEDATREEIANEEGVEDEEEE